MKFYKSEVFWILPMDFGKYVHCEWIIIITIIITIIIMCITNVLDVEKRDYLFFWLNQTKYKKKKRKKKKKKKKKK